MTQTPSFRRSRDLDKSNHFRQIIQELPNDYYSEIKLHNIFHIAYKAIAFCTNKKEPTITFPIPIYDWNDNEAGLCHGGFVHKANRCASTFSFVVHLSATPILAARARCMFIISYNYDARIAAP